MAYITQTDATKQWTFLDDVTVSSAFCPAMITRCHHVFNLEINVLIEKRTATRLTVSSKAIALKFTYNFMHALFHAIFCLAKLKVTVQMVPTLDLSERYILRVSQQLQPSQCVHVSNIRETTKRCPRFEVYIRGSQAFNLQGSCQIWFME